MKLVAVAVSALAIIPSVEAGKKRGRDRRNRPSRRKAVEVKEFPDLAAFAETDGGKHKEGVGVDKWDDLGEKSWTWTYECNPWEYLTDPFWLLEEYLPFSNNWGKGDQDNPVLEEFCCEFAAELVDPTCEDQDRDWGFPIAPKEEMICDLFAQEPYYRTILKQQARDACFCFYRKALGCGAEILAPGGYCDYPHSEVTLDDFRLSNNTVQNMCNKCLEEDERLVYPEHFEGKPYEQCFGMCMLKRGNPKEVYKPKVSDKACCFDGHGSGLELHSYEEKKAEQEIVFFPFGENKRKYDYFYTTTTMPDHDSVKSDYRLRFKYDGLYHVFMEVERYGGNGSTDPALFDISKFPSACQPDQWDSFSIHVFDESSKGGIIFKDVTLDGVDLGAFGFRADQSCASSDVSPDTTGVHGHSRSCVERPGGYGHPGGFELKGTVELSGVFDGDDIGVELVFGCSQKKDEGQCIGAEPWKMPKVSGASNPFSYY